MGSASADPFEREPPREGRVPARIGVMLAASGFALLAVGVWGLARDAGWIAQAFYPYAWWGTILMLDGICCLRRGHSLLTRKRWGIFRFLLWSTTFWFFFELLNFRFQNWYYVGVFRVESTWDLLWGAAFAFACFSTVFVGIFETVETLTALGVFRRWKGRPVTFPLWVSYAVQAFGLVMLTLSLAASEYLAPLVWGSFTFIVDPWNWRHGGRSILRDIERGDYGLFARTFVAGLLCGLLWESFNFSAPQKWIYTVRGLEELKLFEMPLLGFLGFPALALDAQAAWAFISYWAHGNETWEHPGDLSYHVAPRRPLPVRIFLALVPLHLAFWGGVEFCVFDVSVGSLEVRLADVRTLTQAERALLEAQGLRRPRALLDRLEDAGRGEQVAAALGRTPDAMREVRDELRLLLHKGIGRRFADLLGLAGIRRVEDLLGRDLESLHAELRSLAARRGERPPRLEIVRVWVLAARRPPQTRRPPP